MISETTLVFGIVTIVLILTAFLGQYLDYSARLSERLEIESEFLSDDED